jgi:RNA polymerase sigma-70 factor (ECF subfamily)
LDDTELIRASRAGSGDAFGELLARYEKRIFNAVARLLGDPVEAEDVVQDVFLKAYRALDSFQFDSGFYTWLYRIAVNAAVDTRKKLKRRRALSLDDDERELRAGLSSDGPLPDAEPEMDEVHAELRRAIARLPEKFRTILVLREFDGLSYEDLARVLRISKGTVESRLFRARMKLRQKMERHF